VIHSAASGGLRGHYDTASIFSENAFRKIKRMSFFGMQPQNWLDGPAPCEVRLHLERYSVEGYLKKLPAIFYRTPGGAEPVRDWLKDDLPPDDRRQLGFDIGTVEFGWPVGMPLCRSLGGGLWEIRSDLSNNRTARVIFCTAQGRMVLLHGFIKKTEKTSQSDLQLARKRQNEIEQ
jgi:phage-related protein